MTESALQSVDVERVHFTREPLGELRDTTAHLKQGRKPVGLWYSCEEQEFSWSAWCKSEKFIDDLDKLHRVALVVDPASILCLSTVPDIDALNERHGDGRDGIDWWRVADEGWCGIEISPYQWTRRHEYLWYYGWDCASGCIWNPSAIVRVDAKGAES